MLSQGTTLALLAVVFVVLCMIVVWPPSSSTDMAAWAQALTTAAALVVALFIPLHQHERDRTERAANVAREKATQLESAFQLGIGTLSLCEKVLADAELERADSRYLRTALGEAMSLRAMLDKFELRHFDGFEELEPAVSVMAAADAMAVHLRESAARADSIQQKGYLKHALSPMVESLREKVGKLKGVADDAGQAAAKL